jgi:DNA-binding CsgD family transcriptional regulator
VGLLDFINTSSCMFNTGALLELLELKQHTCIFIKNAHSRYCYANDNFVKLMGLQTLRQLINYSDFELSTNIDDAIKYKNLDAEVLDTKSPSKVKEVIMPKLNQPIIKTMAGSLYPLEDAKKSIYVMGIVTPSDKLIKLDLETVFKLSISELDLMLVKKKYTIHDKHRILQFSKMEVKTLVLLLKGKNAGEIACCLQLKQTTVESYVSNIKNKVGLSRKSELIDFVIEANLIEQILV